MRKINCVLCGEDCTESYYECGWFAICDDCYKGKPKQKKLIPLDTSKEEVQDFQGV